ncbi:MAG: hypothetical protein WCI89_03665 [bacterium]
MNTVLGAALVAAGVTPPVTAPNKKKNGGRWKSKTTRVNALEWTHPEIGSFAVRPRNFDIGLVNTKGPFSYAPILTGTKMPEVLEIAFRVDLNPHVFTYTRSNNEGTQPVRLCEEGNIPPFAIAIDWDVRDGQKIAYTRVKDRDNIDLFFMLEDGTFLNLQVAILYRSGVFYLSIQEMGAYEIVRVPNDLVTKQKTYYTVSGGRYALVVLQEEQAFPGADFLKTMGKMGEELIEAAVLDCVDGQGNSLIVEVDEIPIPDWNQPDFPLVNPAEHREGWMGGVVMFCNPIICIAIVLCRDGTQRIANLPFVLDEHGESLMDRGGFPVLLPKEPVFVKLVTNTVNGRSKLTIAAVRHITAD